MTDLPEKLAMESAKILIPGAKIVESLLKLVLPSTQTESFQEAVTNEFQEWIIALDGRVRALEEFEKLSATQTQQILERYEREVRDTFSDEKREALANLVARQWDKSLGTQAIRRYWWDQLSQMSDAEVSAIDFVGESVFLIGDSHSRLLSNKEFAESQKTSQSGIRMNYSLPDGREPELEHELLLVHEEVLDELLSKRKSWISLKRYEYQTETGRSLMKGFALTRFGRAFWRAIQSPFPAAEKA